MHHSCIKQPMTKRKLRRKGFHSFLFWAWWRDSTNVKSENKTTVNYSDLMMPLSSHDEESMAHPIFDSFYIVNYDLTINQFKNFTKPGSLGVLDMIEPETVVEFSSGKGCRFQYSAMDMFFMWLTIWKCGKHGHSVGAVQDSSINTWKTWAFRITGYCSTSVQKMYWKASKKL